MTVSYTSKVATVRGISCFLKLLARWRGSVYKLVWPDLLLFLALYYIISLCYRFVLDAEAKLYFEKIVIYCNKYVSLIPLSFVLGFYVNVVMTRWWSQYTTIPFPDNIAMVVSASVKGKGETPKIIRRTIVRYVCATFTITLTLLSPKLKKRFPTLDHFVEAGLLNPEEKKMINDLDDEFPSYFKFWVPVAWAANLVTKAREEGYIRDEESVEMLLEEINSFRERCQKLLDYDWISVPLVYTQVVTLVVYSYFIITAIGKQYVSSKGDETIDLYFPFLPVLEFFFYMGWLKVAETLINPYGDDDDDFEVVWMADRHLQVCYLLVDKIREQHPNLGRDMHWDETAPNSLPHTVASKKYMEEYPLPSTVNITVKEAEQDLVMPMEREVSEVDGVRQRAGAYLWKLRAKGSGSAGIPLTRVKPFKIRHEYDYRNEVISVDDSNHSDEASTSKPVDCEEFEKLKNARIKDYRRKLLSFANLISWKAEGDNSKNDNL